MRLRIHCKSFFILLIAYNGVVSSCSAKEFLTEKEIDLIRFAQAVESRVKIYMEAAELRLKTAENRLAGKESEEGDPMEFLSPEDMLDGYSQIIKSVILNVDDAIENPGRRQHNIGKALNIVKSETERSLKELLLLKGLAEAKKKEALLDRIDEAISITDEAHESAREWLARLSRNNPK